MKKDQNGFSVVEIMFVLIVVIVICLAGWYVWGSSNKKSTSLPPSSTKNVTSVLKIPELGIQFNLPATLKGLTYQASNGAISFYMPDLNKLAPSCDKSLSSITIVSWTKVNGKYTDTPGTGLVKQFDNFYVASNSPSGFICGNANVRQQIYDLEGKYASALANSESSVELIK
jgi:hypothetical protein